MKEMRGTNPLSARHTCPFSTNTSPGPLRGPQNYREPQKLLSIHLLQRRYYPAEAGTTRVLPEPVFPRLRHPAVVRLLVGTTPQLRPSLWMPEVYMRDPSNLAR